MQYYSTKIRLGGLTTNEVQKVISAPELLVVQYSHGVDAVVDVKKSKYQKVSSSVEKDRLKGLYDSGLKKREQSIDTIFGPLGTVPEVLPDELLKRFDIVDEDDVLAVARSVTDKTKKQDRSQHKPKDQVEADRLESLVSTDEVSLDDLAG